ncbi:hypothetical protein GCM10022199_09470 [Marihabitans asiaticum]
MNQRRAGGMGDELTNAALIGLVGMFGIALVLRAAGSVAAFLTGTTQPEAGVAAGLAVLFNPGDPATALGADGLNPAVYGLVSTALLGGLAPGSSGCGSCCADTRGRQRPTRTDWRGSRPAMRSRPRHPRRHCFTARPRCGPSLASPAPQDIGYLLGASRGTKVWASVEDSILLIGPPRSGKGLHVAINAILDAPARSARSPTTSPPRSAPDAEGAGRSPCSTPNTWLKVPILAALVTRSRL